MGNRPGEAEPGPFRRGQPLRAADLQKLLDAQIPRLAAGKGIKIQTTAGGVVITALPQGAGNAQLPDVFPAQIVSYNGVAVAGPPAIAAGSYQVDLFARGFGNSATRADINATPVDDQSLRFQPGEPVSVFLCNGLYYILTPRPFLLIPGRIISGTNPYRWTKLNYPELGTPIGNPLGPLEIDGGLRDLNSSIIIPPDQNVWVRQICKDESTALPNSIISIGPGVAKYYVDSGFASC